MKGSLSVNSLCVKCREMIEGRTIFDAPDFCKACLYLVRYAGAFMPSGHVSLTLDDSGDAPAVPTPDHAMQTPPGVKVNYCSPDGKVTIAPVINDLSSLRDMVESRLSEIESQLGDIVTDEFGPMHRDIRRLTELFAINDQVTADRDRAFALLRKYPRYGYDAHGDSWREEVLAWEKDVPAVLDPPEITPDDDESRHEYIIHGDKIVKNPNFKGE